MKQLLFFDEAQDEVEEARRWYRERSEPAEESFLRDWITRSAR